MTKLTEILYSAGVTSYSGLIKSLAPFHPKARLWSEGRKDWRSKLKEGMRNAENRKVAWFHAASLGEFEQGRPVIEVFRKKFPEFFILLTFYSPSGYEIRKNYPGADFIAYLPSDTAANARDFISITHPEIAFFIKYEFWYHYLKTLRKNDVKVISFATIFRPDQVFFKKWGGFYRKMLSFFDQILLQDERSLQLLSPYPGMPVLQIAGDTRFDRVADLAENAREFPEIERFINGGFCLVVGSAWAEDMQIIIPVLNRMGKDLKVIIAPHEIIESEIEQWKKQLNLPSLRYSQYKANHFKLPETLPQYLFIDHIGMLASLYRYGSVAYIGGAFGKGLHNTLEAATFGMPVFFGNRNYKKFSEAMALIDLGIAHPLENEQELFSSIHGYLHDRDQLNEIAEKSRDFVSKNVGATQKVIDVAEQLLKEGASKS